MDRSADGVLFIYVYVGEKTFESRVDLALIDGKALAVFEWAPDDSPAFSVELDPTYLHPLSGWSDATHMYEFPIRDPRTPLH